MTTKVPVELVSLDGGVVINESSADADFRVESDNDANALFVWGQYGHLGLGTTTPDKKLVISDGGAQGVEISPAESGVSRLFSYNRSSNAYTTLQIQGSDLRFFTGTSNAEKVRMTSDGLTFNGDTAAANALDDYEEGSWTVAVISSGGSGTYTVSNGYGWYTKIGNMVTVGGSFDLSTSSADSGNMQISGLPYSCSSNGTRPLYVGPVSYTVNVVPQPATVTMGNGSSASILDVWKAGNNSRYAIADWDNGGRMNFQITYEAA